MAPLLPNGHMPIAVVAPSVTITQNGAQLQLASTLALPETVQLLLQGLLAAHQQLVLAQAGQQPLVQPATPATLNGLLKG